MSPGLSSYSRTYFKTFSPGMFLTLRRNVALVKLHFYRCSSLILSLFPSSQAARTNCNNLLSWTISISAGSPSPAGSGPARPFHQLGCVIPLNTKTSTQLHPTLKGANQQLYDVKLAGPFAPTFSFFCTGKQQLLSWEQILHYLYSLSSPSLVLASSVRRISF